MDKLIFFILAVPILIFVFYLGGSAIMTGFKAKMENVPTSDKDEYKEHTSQDANNNIESNKNLSEELTKLNELLKSGVLSQEEFEKAKKKIVG